MSNVMRWRYGDTNPVVLPVASSTVIEIGDFVYQSSGAALPASELAARYTGRPVPNAALLGGLCALSGRMKLASVEAAIRQKFKADVAERNIAAAREAYRLAGGAAAREGQVPHAQAV